MKLVGIFLGCTVIALSSLASELVAAVEPATIYLTHESDSKSHIAVTTFYLKGEKHLAFKLCDIAAPSNCRKIGRYDLYRESQLQALGERYLAFGRAVLAAESIAVATLVSAFAYQTYLHPVVAAEEFIDGAREAALRADGVPAPRGDILLESISSASAMSLPPRAMPPPSIPKDITKAKLESSLFAHLWRYAGKYYKRLVQPLVYSMMLNAWGPVSTFASNMSALFVGLMSPAEHYRASQLIFDIVNAESDVGFTRRHYASFVEYASQYQFESLSDVKNKLEDLLASCPP